MFIIIYLNLCQRVHILNCISYNVCCRKRGDRINVVFYEKWYKWVYTSQWTSIGKSFSCANSWSAVLRESCPVSLESMSSLISGMSFSTLMSCSTKGSTLILSQHMKVSRDLSSEELGEEEEWLSSRLMTTEQGELWWHGLSAICFPAAHAAFCTWVPFSTLSLCSAASALEMFSCFFHFVRRFWNHIFTWKINNNNMYKQKSAHPLIMGESLKTTTPKESSFNNHLLLSKNLLSVVSGTLIAKAECVIGKKWTVNWYHVWRGNRYAQYASV